MQSYAPMHKFCACLFRDSKRYSHCSHSVHGGVYPIPSKRSSCCLVDKEIFLTNWANLCIMICNKCIVIYYKIVDERLPSMRSFHLLIANKTKNDIFEISSPPHEDKCTLKKKGTRCLLANETRDSFCKAYNFYRL